MVRIVQYADSSVCHEIIEDLCLMFGLIPRGTLCRYYIHRYTRLYYVRATEMQTKHLNGCYYTSLLCYSDYGRVRTTVIHERCSETEGGHGAALPNNRWIMPPLGTRHCLLIFSYIIIFFSSTLLSISPISKNCTLIYITRNQISPCKTTIRLL